MVVMDELSTPHFSDDTEARKFLETIRWPHGPGCPHCGVIGNAYVLNRLGKTGKPPAYGLYRCAEPACRKDFTVTTGTVMERSHIALHKWMQGFYLMCASKKGISAHQLHRSLNISYKAAWFMCHRIREAMKTGGLTEPMGGAGRVVEVDETYFGDRKVRRMVRTDGTPYIKSGRSANKRAVVALVERGGEVRSFHVATADKETVVKIVKSNVARDTTLHTDESALYRGAKDYFSEHATVRHSAGEYARRDNGGIVHTNTIEGVFSIFKRGMKGVYQHCSEKHLHRYLSEFDFRYNNREARGINDVVRTAAAVKGAEGKRLTYRQPHVAKPQD
jgi:transposase-like protein